VEELLEAWAEIWRSAYLGTSVGMSRAKQDRVAKLAEEQIGKIAKKLDDSDNSGSDDGND
jgi:hypothetical protein